MRPTLQRWLRAAARAFTTLSNGPSRALHRGLNTLVSASPTTHLVVTVLVAGAVAWWGFGFLKHARAFWTLSWEARIEEPALVGTLMITAGILTAVCLLFVGAAALAASQQAVRHWQHTNPHRFRAMMGMWISLMLAHHRHSLDSHTTLHVRAHRLHAPNWSSPHTARRTRRIVKRITAQRLGLTWRERTLLQASLWFGAKLGTQFVYTPPSSHERLHSCAHLAKAQARFTRFLHDPFIQLGASSAPPCKALL